jgi:asparagine synthetase B (glutamine-hydrolysing)
MNNIEVAAENLRNLLDKAVQRLVLRAPPPKSKSTLGASVAVLFLGGIDSVVLAALCHHHVSSDHSIDLNNVSFYTDSDLGSKTTSSPDGLAANLSFHELSGGFPDRKWRFIAVDVPYLKVLEQERHILQLIAPLDSTLDFNIATAFWFAGQGDGRVLEMNKLDETRRGIDSNAVACNKTVSMQQQEPLLRFSNGQKANASIESSKNLPILHP